MEDKDFTPKVIKGDVVDDVGDLNIDYRKSIDFAKIQSYKNAINRVFSYSTDAIIEYKSGGKYKLQYFIGEILKLIRPYSGIEDGERMWKASIESLVKEELDNWRPATSDGKYIHSFKMKRDMIPFSEGEGFLFHKGANMFVGDQGCGKSTLLHMLMYHKTEYEPVVDVDVTPFIGDYLFLDTERHNPRNMAGEQGGRTDIASIREFMIFANDAGVPIEWLEDAEILVRKYNETFGSRDPIMDAIASNMKSHGETLFPMLQSFIGAKTGLLFIDEPETALSIRSQHKFVDIIRDAISKNNQIFISTHSQIIMEGLAGPEGVLSLEHRKWMSPREFIQTQKP